MRGRPIPQTPAEHHAEAIALLNDALDYPINHPVYLALNARAAAHASLAIYKPTATRKPATPKEPATD